MNGILKLLGLFIFLAGVGIIAATLWHSYKIFTGDLPVPGIFSANDFSSSKEVEVIEGTTEEKMENIIRKELDKGLKGLAPPEIIAKFLNLISWSIFSGIAIFGGSKISTIGITMMKTKKEKNNG